VPAPELSELRAELLGRIGAGATLPLSESDFAALALRVFHYQFDHNAPYRAYCERRGATPTSVRHWLAIPAVPTAAFKAVRLVTDAAPPQAVFRTSGTTGGPQRRGEHILPDLALYDAALLAGFRAHLLPDGARLPILSLVPSPSLQPDSSLSHMAGQVVTHLGAPGSGFFVGPDALDTAGLSRSLRDAEAHGRPVCILSTSLALLHLLDDLDAEAARFALPPGSRLMDTGGFKGRERVVGRDELYAQVAETLGIPAAWAVNEYGMTEMSSQFYDAVAGEPGAVELGERLYRGPSWVRTRAVDPETLAILPIGETGILRHWDLANLGSVLALQTEDLGVIRQGGFELHGRATAAEPRGCSLAMDELLSAVRRHSDG
jgi:hypothetical protein